MIEPFKKINEADKEKLLKDLEAVTYYFEQDTSLLSSIKMHHAFGIVIHGTIQVIKTDYNGNRTIVDELVENSVFGSQFSYLIDDEYDLIALEPSQILLFDYYGIINYPRSDSPAYNQFIRNLLEITALVISSRDERIKILTKKSIRSKLLEYFEIMARKHGSRSFYLPFTFTDLADYLAVDRSAMSREMKYLKEEKIITVKNKKITLLTR